MNFNGNMEFVKLHQDDMEQRANHRRLLESLPKRERRENALLTAVGRQMIALGHRLEALGQADENVTLQPEIR